MAADSLMHKLRGMAEPPKPKEEQPDVGDDSVESPAGDGRWARHQVFAVQLVQANRNAQAVTYASIHSTLDYVPSRGIRFRYENDDGMFEVLIEGNNLDRIFDKLCAGKMELIRVTGETVTAITVRAVKKDKA